jgi:nucleoid DNA-binding protein
MTLETRLPYPGLRTFTREESDLFFGRDGCVDKMVDRLAATRFLAVLGPSGSGKSSLVRTGLLDALDLGLHSSAGSHWKIAEMHPGKSPLRNLAAALLRARDRSTPNPEELSMLSEFLGHGPRSVGEWAAGGNLTGDWNLLILVDQFEELFRYGDYAQREEAEAFAALLLETASVPNLKLHVVLTMRSEYLGACSLLPGLAERVNDGIYLTPRMSRDECREAIEGPARVLGFRVEPALVNRLLNDLASFAPWQLDSAVRQSDQLARRADQLPLMQHVLNRLWLGATTEAGGQMAELKLAEYEDCGGLSGAIDTHAKEVMDTLGERAACVEAVFRALVSGPSVALAVRRPCRMRDLVQILDSNRDDAVAVVKAFSAADCNFLKPSDPSLDDEAIIDISHESLIRQWSLLGEWLEKEARDRAEWKRLTAAQKRHAAGTEQLLSELNLRSLAAWFDEAKPTAGWAARHGGGFKNAVAFLQQSAEAEGIKTNAERRRDRRERNLLRAGVGVLASLLVYAILAALQVADAKKKEQASDKRLVNVLEEVGRTLQSDEYVSLIGFGGFQSRLATELAERQADLEADINISTLPASRVRTLFRQATALDEEGNITGAMAHYKNAYYLGVKEINSTTARTRVSDDLKLVVIKDAGRYAWRLYDTGEITKGNLVIAQMKRWIGQQHPNSDDWLTAEATLSSLSGRYERERGNTTEAERNLRRAAETMEPIRIRAIARPGTPQARQGPRMDQMQLAYWLQMGLLRSAKNPAERAERARNTCALADAMINKNPMDRRAITATITCLVGEVAKFRDATEVPAAAERARKLVEAALTVAPADQSLLLLRAQIESALALHSMDHSERDSHMNQAKEDFVKALKEGTVFMTSAIQFKDLYQTFKDAEVAYPAQAREKRSALSTDASIKFYTEVQTAIGRVVTAFPNARVFKDVGEDASQRIRQLTADKMKKRTL